MAGRVAARHAAERFVEKTLAGARHSYGDDVQAQASALVARFPSIWWDYDGPDRRLVLMGEFEVDPDAR